MCLSFFKSYKRSLNITLELLEHNAVWHAYSPFYKLFVVSLKVAILKSKFVT